MRYELNDKRSVRSRVGAARRALTVAERVAAGDGLCTTALSVAEVSNAEVVCCYVAIGAEPSTDALLTALDRRGARVLLPILLADGELDWAVYEGISSLAIGLRGTRSPAGPRRGIDAIAAADAVLAPGVAVDQTGVRLGRGGGSYDRALSRARVDAFTAVLLYDNEIVSQLPHEPHDERVTAAITPTRVVRF